MTVKEAKAHLGKMAPNPNEWPAYFSQQAIDLAEIIDDLDDEQPTNQMQQNVILCPDCEQDDKVFCPRDVDGECLVCKQKFCAAHLLEHFEKVHCMVLNLKHCSTT